VAVPIELVLTHPSPDVYVAVDGVLVVDGANTSRVRIDGIATGYAAVAIAMGDGEKQQRLWVEEGGTTVWPLGSSGGSPWDSIKSVAISLAGIALYALIRGRAQGAPPPVHSHTGQSVPAGHSGQTQAQPSPPSVPPF